MLVACGCSNATAPAAPSPLETSLEALVDNAVAEHPGVRGAALWADSPVIGLRWQGATGDADLEGSVPMSPEHPVRIASNTKTFVAAAVLRLAEEGRLGIDDPVATHLPAELRDLLEGDGYDLQAITVRHLLTHTSGLFDHTSDERFEEAIMADPQRRWTRAEQVAAAVEWGAPHAAPGEVYTYCDTGYVLLGEIVERASGRPLAAAVRELVGFERLGMDSTWWEILEPPPDGSRPRAHQFLDDLDTFAFDPSFDLYGGGGIVATVGDLARFWRALFSGGVFADPATLDTMLTTLGGVRGLEEDQGALPPGAYRMGVWDIEAAGLTAYRHTGFWGTSASYVPDLDLVVTATVNQNRARDALAALVDGAIAAAADAQAAAAKTATP
jgi:D-alanyl-D-alanine carboxypeptidase